jgi:hypothetical protein
MRPSQACLKDLGLKYRSATASPTWPTRSAARSDHGLAGEVVDLTDGNLFRDVVQNHGR